MQGPHHEAQKSTSVYLLAGFSITEVRVTILAPRRLCRMLM